jgi:dTMP kinase
MFITLEGPEGSGKTTQLKHLAADLTGRGYECLVTREPGGTPIGAQIRKILLHPDSRGMAPLAELFLYEADRAEHLHRQIRPALAQGKVVVCDRFYDATVAYQGYGRGLALDFLHHLHRVLTAGLTPDLTLLLDLAPEVGLARTWKQMENGGRDLAEARFEEEALAFHRRVRAGYLELARGEPQRFRVLDAARDAEQVTADIRAVLEEIIPWEKP